MSGFDYDSTEVFGLSVLLVHTIRALRKLPLGGGLGAVVLRSRMFCFGDFAPKFLVVLLEQNLTKTSTIRCALP